jgi:hypothetical protein
MSEPWWSFRRGARSRRARHVHWGRIGVEREGSFREGDGTDSERSPVPLCPYYVGGTHAKLRPLVIPERPPGPPVQLELPFGEDAGGAVDAGPGGSGSGLSKVQRISWARLLKRRFAYAR